MVHQSTASRWRAIVARQEASGKTIKAFATDEGINPSTLSWWRWKLRRGQCQADARGVRFTELRVDDGADESSSSGGGSVVLTLDHRPAHVVVDRDTDLDLLRRVMEALC